MSVKRLVHYDPAYPVVIFIGFGAYVKTVDHDAPGVSNSKMVHTSPVVKYDGEGCFETMNSLYVPIKSN